MTNLIQQAELALSKVAPKIVETPFCLGKSQYSELSQVSSVLFVGRKQNLFKKPAVW